MIRRKLHLLLFRKEELLGNFFCKYNFGVVFWRIFRQLLKWFVSNLWLSLPVITDLTHEIKVKCQSGLHQMASKKILVEKKLHEKTRERQNRECSPISNTMQHKFETDVDHYTWLPLNYSSFFRTNWFYVEHFKCTNNTGPKQIFPGWQCYFKHLGIDFFLKIHIRFSLRELHKETQRASTMELNLLPSDFNFGC